MVSVETPLKKERKKNVCAKPSRATDPRVKEYIDWFAAEYQRRFNRSFHVTWGKEGMLVKGLLVTFDLATLKRCAVALFESEDPFYEKAGRGIGTLSNQVNKVAEIADRRSPGDARPTLEPLDYREATRGR